MTDSFCCHKLRVEYADVPLHKVDASPVFMGGG